MELWRKRNVDTRIVFPIVDADGDPVTGAANLDSEYALFNSSGHGGAAPSFTDCTHEATEIGSTGIYYLDVSAGEIDADFSYIQIKTSTSGAKTQHILIRTTPADANATQIEGADATDQIRDALVDDATRLDASALNTLAGHDPGEAIMGATDLGTGAGLTTLATAADLATVAGYVDTEIGAIKAVTDKLDTTLEADGPVSRFTQNALEQGPTGGAAPTAAQVADAVWDEAKADHAAAGSFGKQVQDIAVGSPPTAEAIRQEMDANSTQLAALVAGVTVTDMATNAIDADSLSVDAGNELADAILKRGAETVESASGPHSLASAILHATGRTRRNGNTLETYRSDGVTLHMIQQLTPDPTGQPVAEIGDATAV